MKMPQIISSIDRDSSRAVSLDDVFELAKGYMNQRWSEERDIPPLWFCLTPDRMMVVFTPWDSDADKNRMALMMRGMFDGFGVEAYAFMSEAWVANITPDTPEVLAMQMPMDRPDRKEVVMLNAFEKGSDKGREKYFDIVRKAGRDAYLVESKMMAGVDGATGRMFNLLRPLRKPH